ncbi:MAG: hypothetical protein MJ119_03565, partial [Lachnospiraceae bacterium]|nr:hypothetical protein [Lachnospiraceae bacterium]
MRKRHILRALSCILVFTTMFTSTVHGEEFAPDSTNDSFIEEEFILDDDCDLGDCGHDENCTCDECVIADDDCDFDLYDDTYTDESEDDICCDDILIDDHFDDSGDYYNQDAYESSDEETADTSVEVESETEDDFCYLDGSVISSDCFVDKDSSDISEEDNASLPDDEDIVSEDICDEDSETLTDDEDIVIEESAVSTVYSNEKVYGSEASSEVVAPSTGLAVPFKTVSTGKQSSKKITLTSDNAVLVLP